MSHAVRDSYDAMAALYAELFIHDLNENANARKWLAVFAEHAMKQSGVVADVGCGPGHVANHLVGLGARVIGYDLSPGQIAQARQAFPDLTFEVGDLAAVDCDDAALGGIVARYSIIHLEPAELGGVFLEWMRVLEPGAPLLVSFFGALSADTHGTAFDHKVVTAYALFPPAIGSELTAAGFAEIEIDTLPPPEGGRPFSQATILARKPVR